MKTPCLVCKRCPFVNGVCEDRANRGRRFFLMGALALPVARKIETMVPKTVKQYPTIQIGDNLPEIFIFDPSMCVFRSRCPEEYVPILDSFAVAS